MFGFSAKNHRQVAGLSWIGVTAITLAISLQIQATLPVGAAGIRVAVSDILLPVLFLVSIFCGQWTFPDTFRFRLPGAVLWLIGLIAVLTFSLLNGYMQFHEWMRWAVINKWLGGILLTGYFIAGGAIVRSSGLENRNSFLAVFIAAASIVAAANSLAMPWILPENSMPIAIRDDRAVGLMQNANAFGFLLTIVILLSVSMRYRVQLCVPACLTGLWFASSRGSMIALICGLAVFAIQSPRQLVPLLKPAVLSCLLIVVISALVGWVDPARFDAVGNGRGAIGFFSAERVDPDADTIEQRKAQVGSALTTIAEAPIIGHGLGYFLKVSGQSLHNSLLWLVIETGLVGAAVFTSFLVLAVWYLWQGREDPFLLGMLAVSVAFMVMSLTGEYLYQRHLWLLLGMALVRPPEPAVVA